MTRESVVRRLAAPLRLAAEALSQQVEDEDDEEREEEDYDGRDERNIHTALQLDVAIALRAGNDCERQMSARGTEWRHLYWGTPFGVDRLKSPLSIERPARDNKRSAGRAA
jgi:hypothetical protein